MYGRAPVCFFFLFYTVAGDRHFPVAFDGGLARGPSNSFIIGFITQYIYNIILY